jgi:phytoene synthase
VLLPDQTTEDPVLLAWADASRRFDIPHGYVRQLLHGLGQDLRPQPLQTFDEFADYAYGVAGSVALISLQIIGYAGAEAIPYAIKLGVALQLTKALRDISEDWSMGRVYLPREEMGQFGISLANLNDRRVNDRWRAFMRFQIARNRQLYAEAWPGIGLLHPDGRFAALAAIDYSRALLDDIEAHDYDVFGRQAHVSPAASLRRLLALWRQNRHWRSPNHVD